MNETKTNDKMQNILIDSVTTRSEREKKSNKPNTVIELDINMASNQTSAIFMLVNFFVELCRVPSGFLMPKYRPKLMKHI